MLSPARLPLATAWPLTQDVDLTVSRQVDEERYDFDVGQRVFVDVSPEQMMGFDWHEISTGATDV